MQVHIMWSNVAAASTDHGCAYAALTYLLVIYEGIRIYIAVKEI